MSIASILRQRYFAVLFFVLLIAPASLASISHIGFDYPANYSQYPYEGRDPNTYEDLGAVFFEYSAPDGFLGDNFMCATTTSLPYYYTDSNGNRASYTYTFPEPPGMRCPDTVCQAALGVDADCADEPTDIVFQDRRAGFAQAQADRVSFDVNVVKGSGVSIMWYDLSGNQIGTKTIRTTGITRFNVGDNVVVHGVRITGLGVTNYAIDNVNFEMIGWDDKKDQKSLGCNCKGANQLVGHPINTAIGNKYRYEPDIVNPAGGLPFARYYNSLSGRNMGFGPGWTTTYDSRLALTSKSTLTLFEKDGRGESWTESKGKWTGDVDTVYQLAHVKGKLRVTKRDGSYDTYGPRTGLILSSVKANGQTTTFTYDSNNHLVTVTGPFGHQLNFTYNQDGNVDTMTDSAGQVYHYAYDSIYRLRSVTYPDNTQRVYHYENTHYLTGLTGITDARGDRIMTFGYNRLGKADLTELATTTNGAPQESFAMTYNGSETDVTDASGQVWAYMYQRNLGTEDLLSVTNQSDGKGITQSFDASNNITQSVDADGNVTQYAYDATNQMTSKTVGAGTPQARTTTYQYLSPTLNLVTRKTTPSVRAGQVHEVLTTYDPNTLNITSITENGYKPDGTAISRTTAFQYNSAGEVTQIDGPRTDVSDVTNFTYYNCDTGGGCGRLASITDALGYITTFDSYDASGRLTQKTDPNGVVTAYQYNVRGDLTSMTQTAPGDAPRTTTYDYDADGDLTSVATPDGRTLSYTYDTDQDLTWISDNLGNSIHYTYDIKGNRSEKDIQDPNGTLARYVKYTHDIRNNLSSINRGGAVTQLVHDAVGNLISKTDADNNSPTTYVYDVLNRLTATTDAMNGNTQYGYDTNNALVNVVAPNGVTTSYAVDDFGDRVSEVSPDRGTIQYQYDPAGNVISKTDARGIQSTVTYDALNRITSIKYPDTVENVSLIYDTCYVGRLCEMTDQSGITTYSYNGYGQLTSKTQKVGGVTETTAYGYDGGGRLDQLTYPSGMVVTYKYNGYQIGEIDADGTVVVSNIQYDPFGPVDGWTWGNGSTDVRTYNQQGLITQLSLGTDARTLAYDPNGNVTSIQDANGSSSFTYDPLNRITAASGPGFNQQFSYDSNGNRVAMQDNGVARTYSYAPGTNRISGSTDGSNSISYSYDASGDLLADGSYTFSYGDSSRMMRADGEKYLYNGLGERLIKQGTSGSTIYTYGKWGKVLGEYDGSGKEIEETVYLQELPIATVRNGVPYYVFADQLGAPRVVTKADNTVVWEWLSDPFGDTPAQQDPNGGGVDFVYNLRGVGQAYDPETGNFYNHFRYYNPVIGRYDRNDPIGLASGLNTYEYVFDNPLGKTDPMGLFSAAFNKCVHDYLAQNYGDFVADHLVPDFSVQSYLPGSGSAAEAWATTAELAGVKGGLLAAPYAAGQLYNNVSQPVSEYLAFLDGEPFEAGIVGDVLMSGSALAADTVAVAGTGALAFATTANVIADLHCRNSGKKCRKR